ncbi:MAG: S8 family serine peptidase [Bacteroidetes bacterium]|nr:S8 family serine peptidase [Bacteroidota bacterium]
MHRKILQHVLALACVLFTGQLQAQQAYYWSEGQTFALDQDRSGIALHFFPGSMPASLQQLQGNHGITEVTLHPAHNRAILQVDGSWTGSAAAFAERLGLPAGSLRSAAFGFQYESTRMWLTHDVVLMLEPGTSLTAYSDLLQKHRAQFSRYRNDVTVLNVEQPEDALALANAIAERGGVAFCHPDFYAPIAHMSDPNYPQQFQMNNTGQTIDGFAGVADIDINGPEAWAISTGNPSMIVAVVDDGVETHEDLRTAGGVSRVLSGFTPATGGTGGPISSGAHGQACAGIIAASHNTLGVKGVAPQVQLVPVNIFAGGETTQDLADAITFAKNSGAAVISNSWGYPGSCTLNYSNLTNAINDASNNGRGGLGSVVVFAAGNSYGTCVDYPAYIASVVAVGAVTNQGARSLYSNQGTALDVVAPSNPAPGQAGAGVRTIDRTGAAGYSSGNYTPSFGGTSAACPAVAGVAALVLSVDPGATAASVRSTLASTATDMGAPGFDNAFGNGRVNAFAAITGATIPTVTFNGTVLDASTSAPLSGVQVRYDGPGGSFSTTTNASGQYTVSGLIDGGFYLIYLGKWGHKPRVDAASAVSGGSKASTMQAGFGDDFEFNLGWTGTGTASTGLWARGIPIGTTFEIYTANPGDDSDDQGLRAYVTGNGGGGAGTDDVDGGTAILTSPVFSLDGLSDPYVSYCRWFFNAGGTGTPDDNLTISLTNGLTTVAIETIGGSGLQPGGWASSTRRVSDYLTPTANMRLIAQTADGAVGHLVEAGLDKFRAFDSIEVVAVCTNPPTGLNALVGATGVTLSWNSLASEGAVSYTVSGRKAGVGSYQSLPATLEPSTSKFVAENKLRAGLTYDWKVQATCTGGVLSPESAIGGFTWPGLREGLLQESKLLPNPASDQAVLTFNADGQPATLRVTDLAGRTLISLDATAAEGPAAVLLSVSHLETGLYFVELQQQSARQVFELVIAR